jgi:ribonucleoside-diphosphate reductase alpha chain
MGATHAEKSTVTAGAMNAVSSGASGGMSALDAAAAAAQHAIDATPATDIKFCAIDNPDCEACQ